MVRVDDDDEVYRTADEKYEAIIALIEDCRERGQPILVGTTSIEKSENSSPRCSKKEKVPHQVLNARYHEQEAFIIAQAGVPGRGHHRHQHGRPRHRHPARRQRSTCASAQELADMPEGAGARGARAPRSAPRSPS